MIRQNTTSVDTEREIMGTGTPVNPKETITANKMNLKLETIAENPVDVTSSRAFDVEYQNSDPKRTLHVIVNSKTVLSHAGTAYIIGYTRIPPAAEVAGPKFGHYSNTQKNHEIYGSISLYVPPGAYYTFKKTEAGNGVLTLGTWIEILL